MSEDSPALSARRLHLPRAAWCRSLIAAASLALLASCARAPAPAPLPQEGNGALIFGPDQAFNPAKLPPEWWTAPSRPLEGVRIADLSGVPALELKAGATTLMGRHMSEKLLAAPYLRWGWYLMPAAYGGGAGDGLDRGVRLVVGFKGGQPRGIQLTDRLIAGLSSDLPVHDRRLELVLGGIGAPRMENARIRFTAVSDRGMTRDIRKLAFQQTGQWLVENVDLSALYAHFWPEDRRDEVDIVFVAVSALPAKLPPDLPPAVGYVAEILLFR
jgi:hypothetical protein